MIINFHILNFTLYKEVFIKEKVNKIEVLLQQLKQFIKKTKYIQNNSFRQLLFAFQMLNNIYPNDQGPLHQQQRSVSAYIRFSNKIGLLISLKSTISINELYETICLRINKKPQMINIVTKGKLLFYKEKVKVKDNYEKSQQTLNHQSQQYLQIEDKQIIHVISLENVYKYLKLEIQLKILIDFQYDVFNIGQQIKYENQNLFNRQTNVNEHFQFPINLSLSLQQIQSKHLTETFIQEYIKFAKIQLSQILISLKSFIKIKENNVSLTFLNESTKQFPDFIYLYQLLELFQTRTQINLIYTGRILKQNKSLKESLVQNNSQIIVKIISNQRKRLKYNTFIQFIQKWKIKQQMIYKLFKQAIDMRNKGYVQELLQILQVFAQIYQQNKQPTKQIANLHNQMGLMNLKIHNYHKAIQNFKRSLQIKQKLSGKQTNSYATSMNNLGVAYYKNNDLAEAMQCLEKSKFLRQHSNGRNSIQAGCSYFNLSYLYRKVAQFNKAKNFAKKAYQIHKTFLGSENHLTKKILKIVESLSSKLKTESLITIPEVQSYTNLNVLQ